jgi:hypothetical protein
MKPAGVALIGAGFVFAGSLLVIAFLMVASNTTPNTIAVPSSGFFTSNCISGCWQGLEPGKTSATTATNMVRGRYSPDIRTSRYDKYMLLMASYADRVNISFTVTPEILMSIEIAGTTDLSLAHIISNLGKPGYVEFEPRLTPGSTIDIQKTLYYPEKGYVFYLGSPPAKGTTTLGNIATCLSGGDKVRRSKVVIPGQIQEVLRNIELPFGEMSTEGIAVKLSKLSTWPGFTCVNIPFSQP